MNRRDVRKVMRCKTLQVGDLVRVIRDGRHGARYLSNEYYVLGCRNDRGRWGYISEYDCVLGSADGSYVANVVEGCLKLIKRRPTCT